MITISCCFAHSFKIMRIPQPGWADVILLRTSQAIWSGKGYKIDIAYIRCSDGREPEVFEFWAFAEDGIHEFHPFARVQIRDDFTKDTFYTEFSMHKKFKFLSWVADPRMEASNGSMRPVQICKLEFFSKSRIGLKILSFTRGVPIQLLFRRMFLLSGDMQLRMFLLTPKLSRGISTRELSRTFLTGLMLPPMKTAGLKIPTLTDMLRTLSTIRVSAIGSFLGSTCLLESLIMYT